ncbi:PKD-like family lipoprotein [Chryseolinea lacunae]|uniref:PKD-like family protein n=1 Tax=Chryseolinea lacunae TaxID=2801331 RepID=A0ABS1KU58_9BACT|nr:PKD-like family lipoprotein [Chryseolinea lacunae]MBL0742994.1 hypothetical protein [Chryseolinea lacunae]
MKKSFASLLFFGLMALTSCYNDLGNYTYNEVEEPIVTGMQVKIVAFVGDSLIIRPTVKHSLSATDQMEYKWDISNPVDLREEFYDGKNLNIVCHLKESTYSAKFIVTDKSNGMKYFFPFKIEVRSEFTKGTLVLSDVGGVAQLAFVKPDETVQANIYEALHGEPLPHKPLQLFSIEAVPSQDWYNNYFVLCGEPDKPGVMLSLSTLFRKRYLAENFFTEPKQIQMGSLVRHGANVPTGVINGKLYIGAYTTAPFSPVFGKFGDAMPGDYKISDNFIYAGSHYLGFDVNRQQFVQFGAVGDYAGAQYEVMSDEGVDFNPKAIGKELVYMQMLTGESTYAFFRNTDGTLQEAKFMHVPGMIFPKSYRVFSGSNLVDANTKWQGSFLEIIYFTSGSNIYRYNPLNQDLQRIEQDFGGKNITMLKLIDNDLLVAGVEGALYYMDVSAGKYGDLLKKVGNIPGNPIDIVIRR